MTFWIMAGAMVLVALALVLIPLFKAGQERKPWLIAALGLMIPLSSVLIYQKLGTPTAAAQLAMNNNEKMNNVKINKLADKLAEKLQAQPDNAEGWVLLARIYAKLDRPQAAIPAFEKATSLLPDDPDLLADYAYTLASSNNGNFDQKYKQLISHALQIDPLHVRSLSLKAAMAYYEKDYPVAIAAWEKITTIQGLDEETLKQSKANIEEAHRMMSAQ